MLKQDISDYKINTHDNQFNEFNELLCYIDQLATYKLGYPVSLLTYLGVVDNSVLGIQPNSLANVLLNNVGDPFKDSETSLMEVKRHEREVIAILEHYYGLEKNGARGYVTTGGTEGNFAALWWSKRYLINTSIDSIISRDDIIKQQLREEQQLSFELTKIPTNDYQARLEHLQKIVNLQNSISENKNIVQQLLTPTIFYSKGHTHYSIPKIAEIQHLNIKPVASNPDGSLNLDNLKKEILFHIGAHPYCPVIVIANIGTTFTGAIDDVPGIKKVLEETRPKLNYTIHMDGALTGFVLPIIKPFGDVANYFDAIGANSLAVSAHKYPGLSQPCGIILAKRSFFEKAFEKSQRSIDYVGNILDVTITGSRSGLNVLMFYNALCTLGLQKDNSKLIKMVKGNIENGKYLENQLIQIYGKDRVSYPFQFNVIFPRPSAALARKYQLMLTGDNANICVLTNAGKELIDRFISDLKLDLIQQQENKENDMTTKTTSKSTSKTSTTDKAASGYTIKPLTRDYMQSAADLFIKTFCDDEPITKHLGIQYHEYEPFALAVIQKAVTDGLSTIAVDSNNRVVACAIGEDITDTFKPTLAHYPKMKPIFGLIETLSKPFFSGKKFKKGKVAHTWIAMVDKAYRGKGLSTEIDLACTNYIASKGSDFTYAEFTNDISENITHHYPVSKKFNEIIYEDFTFQGLKPFKGVKGCSTAYVLGINPDVEINSFRDCYIIEEENK